MSVEYSIYRQEILDFLQTVTIKFSLFADIMAKRVEDELGIVITKDTENPYYQNLCGMYSVLDTPIYVTTLETNTEVLFDTNLVRLYPKTAALYRVPSKEYLTLCAKYPNQLGLIKSIVYPIKDLETAISASNFSLLQYDSGLLHVNERESLISCLRRTLNYIYERWYVADYYYEEMYPVTFMGLLWAHLPHALLAQRVQNLKTSSVHPLHIWEYLFSKGLADYRDILTDSQALFLYRNIDYILQNKGKKSTLEILAENLLKNLQITLVGKTILQQTITGYDDCTLIPEFLSEDVIRLGSNEQIEETVTESMEVILTRVANEGYFPDLNSEKIVEKQERFGNTELNIIPTRLLELKKAILNTPYERLLGRFIFDSFMYHLVKGHFSYNVKMVDPNMNLPLNLNVAQTLALFQYAHAKTLGIELSTLPVKVCVSTPYVDTKPSLSTLPKTISVENNTYLMSSVVDVDTTLNEIPFDKGPYTNIDDFFNVLASQFVVLVKHIESLRTDGNYLYHKALNTLYDKFLVNQTFDYQFIQEDNYSTWIDSTPQIKNLISAYESIGNNVQYYINLRDYLLNQLIPTEHELFQKYTAFNLDHSKLYNGLKRLFIQLCSYRLTFLETERGVVTFIIIPPIVLGDVSSSYEDSVRVEISTPWEIMASRDHCTIDITTSDNVSILDSTSKVKGIVPISAGANLGVLQSTITDILVDTTPFTILEHDDLFYSDFTGLSFGTNTNVLIQPI